MCILPLGAGQEATPGVVGVERLAGDVDLDVRRRMCAGVGDELLDFAGGGPGPLENADLSLLGGKITAVSELAWMEMMMTLERET